MKWSKPKPLKRAIHEFEKTGIPTPNVQSELLVKDVSINEQILRGVFQNCSDIVFRPVLVNGQTKMLLVYVDGLVDTKVLDQVVLKPMIFEGMPDELEKIGSFREIIREQLIAISQVQGVYHVSDVVEGILKANVAVLIHGEDKALIADLKGFEQRSTEEPVTEVAVRGARDGFTETLRVNTSLVRRRIRSSRLKMEAYTIGDLTKTDIVIAYLDGIASDRVLQEVRRRVGRIQVDGVLGSGYVEEFIEDLPFSPFPQVQDTERPDVAAASILEGRVAIFVDTTPFVLIVPYTFWSAFQSIDDYNERFIYSTAVRWLRYCLFMLSLFLPSIYVAITTFHPQLIPRALLISIAAAQAGTPLPTVVEVLLMEAMFEGLREAGIRLPKPVGSAVSIVGALVIGEASVQAGFISAPIVIVVATTGIASFTIPRYNMTTATRILRFPLLISAGTLGLYGVVCGALVILIHLTTLRSFGMPYLAPVAPRVPQSLDNTLVRAPHWSLIHRLPFFSREPTQRIPKGQRPRP